MNNRQTSLSSDVALEKCGPRRLPVYFVIDYTASAGGSVAHALRQVREVLAKLRLQAEQDRDEYNRAPVHYSVIVFRTSALQLQPLASLWTYSFDELQLEEIQPGGASGLGDALATLSNSFEQELKMPGSDNGDFTPQVFLFTNAYAIDWKIHKQVLSNTKTFVCDDQPPNRKNGDFSRQAPPFIQFLSADCHAHIHNQIGEARTLLRSRQQMIDYPTSY